MKQLFLFCLVTVAAFETSLRAESQTLQEQPIPFSVWLDFQELLQPSAPHLSLPIWLESVQSHRLPEQPGMPRQTVFRLRFRQLPQINRELQLRLYFEDMEGQSPVVTGWTETGTRQYQSAPQGTGIGLPTSTSLLVPSATMDYLDITTPGDGKNLRGVFLTSMVRTAGRAAIDFAGPSGSAADPFSNLPPQELGQADTALFGRVRATLEADVVKLDRDITFEFGLEHAPLAALISFEALNVDIAYPPVLTMNDQPLGPAKLRLPDLADPGFEGQVRAMEPAMRFRYAGWLPCQALVPAASLRAGLNRLNVMVNKEGGTTAIRALEIQLKYPTRSLDFSVTP